MNRLRIGHFGRADDRRNVQIAVFRRRGPDADRLIGELYVLCIGIGFRMHDHRADSHLTASTLHPQRDLTAIGDQNLLKHGRSEARGEAPRHVESVVLFNDEQRLAVLHRLPVLDEDFLDLAADLRFDFVQ